MKIHMFDPDGRKERLDESQKEGLAFFMEDRTTKLMMGLLPEGPPNVLQTLISAAFEAGFSGGQGSALMEVASLVIGRSEAPEGETH